MYEYNVIVKLSTFFSVWLLSCILLYTYNYKNVSNIEYNKLMSKMNTTKLKHQLNTLNNKVVKYHAKAYPTETMDITNEEVISGLAEAKKEVYTELIKTIEIYERCNLVRVSKDGSSFPWSEVMIAVLLIMIVIGVILVFNLTNNPFRTMDKKAELDSIGDEIEQTFSDVETNLKNQGMLNEKLDSKFVKKLNERFTGGANPSKAAEPPSMETTVEVGGSSMLDTMRASRGGFDPNSSVSDKMQGSYNNLLLANMKISSKIAKVQSDITFSYIVVAISIVMLSVYISIKLFKNTMRFTDTLYSGRLFMNSRCYNM